MLHETTVQVSKDQKRGTCCDNLVHNRCGATSFTPTFADWHDKTVCHTKMRLSPKFIVI